MKVCITTAILLAYVVSLGAARADDVVDGRTGPGAFYRLVHPTNWNGRLVLYAHGMVSKEDPVSLPPEADELADAFSDLVAWVEFGVPPTP